jgi:hypothetical protein
MVTRPSSLCMEPTRYRKAVPSIVSPSSRSTLEESRRSREQETKGGGLGGAAAGSRSVNPIERRLVVYDRIRLDPTIYEPISERLRKQSLERLV